MPQRHQQLSTLATIGRPRSSHHHLASHLAGPSIHLEPTPHIIASSIPHEPSHSSIAGLATQPHPTATESIAGSSSSTAFSYPTPSHVPASSGIILGLSISLGLVLALLALAGVLHFMHRKGISGSGKKAQDDETKLTRIESEAEPQRTVGGREYSPSHLGKRETQVRTWYGRKVPSGWI